MSPALQRGAGAALALTLAVWSPLGAQAVGGGVLLQTYRFDEPQVAGVESFRLLTVPFAASVPLGSFASLVVTGSRASGLARAADGQEATLSSFSDTDLSIDFSPGPDWLLIGTNVTLPTGRNTLSIEEAVVAGIVAAELLPFAISTWGSGGGFGGNVAAATQAGRWGIGMSAGYQVAREFEPLPDLPIAFNPGDQLQLRVAADRDVGASSTFSALLGFQRFSSDAVLGTNLFSAGSRIEAVLSYAFPMGLRSSALVYGGVYHRSQGTLLTDQSVIGGATDSPSQQLFMTGTHLRVPFGRGSALVPRAELLVFRAEDGASQGWVATFGSTFDARVAGNSTTTRLVLAPSAQFRVGNVIVEEGSESRFLGWELGLTLRLEAGR